MGIRVNVQGGTNAGWRRIRTQGVSKCVECGAFVSATRRDEGAYRCLRCEAEHA